jgi:pyrimidine-nucleoside phosphorylase
MNFLPSELIKKKRRGQTHTREELHFLIKQYSEGLIPDYQMSAWLMAVFFQGMDRNETSILTQEMMNSGKVIDLSSIPGKKVDKHSTGGVGDKASLILGPIAAAAGVPVPMIAGRGLGHTGGTLDKLESVPGFNIHLNVQQFAAQIASLGISIIGQTSEICPADKKLYALRDVTGTVESLPLICGSIMSKKLAEGIDGLVMDVKVGSGAFMKKLAEAEALANSLRAIGEDHGKKVAVLISNMNQPLGRFVGNSLEVYESLQILDNQKFLVDGLDLYADTRELSLELAAHMIWLAGRSETPEEGLEIAANELRSGRALRYFHNLITSQGGRLETLPQSQKIGIVRAQVTGFISAYDCEKIGVAAIHLKAGRQRTNDAIEPTAGIEMHYKLGQWVEKGTPLFTLFGTTAADVSVAQNLLLESCTISLQNPSPADLILKRLID